MVGVVIPCVPMFAMPELRSIIIALVIRGTPSVEPVVAPCSRIRG
jgi:hypothetical protein